MATKPFVVLAVYVLLVACTSASSHEPPNEPRLAPKAARELEALGYRKYEGTAKISAEKPSVGHRPQYVTPAKVTFDPASGPRCLDGSPYSVWYADRHSDDLILMLDGGGACWSSMCSGTATLAVDESSVSGWAQSTAFPDAPDQGPTDSKDPSAGPVEPVDDTAFSSWNAVSFPYCDGSVFMGDNDVPVPEDGNVHHFHGRQNLAAGLDVAVAHFSHPKRVLLIGWSAGGYGTITAMIATRLRYPYAELYVLDDSGPGVQNLEETTDVEERLSEWNYGELFPESCTECAGGRGQLAPLFDWMLERDRDVRIGVASYYQDLVISQFLRLPPPNYEPLLRETLTPIFEAHPDRFKRFMLPGQGHVLSPRQKAAGVPLDTWTVAMTKRDEATWVDILADCPYRCCHPDQASCEAEPGCTAVFGKAVLSHPDTFVGCISQPSHCDDVVTCAEGLLPNASDSGCRMFPNSCIPNGWQEFPCEAHYCGPWDLDWGKN